MGSGVEGRDALRHPTMHRRAPPQQRFIPLNVNSCTPSTWGMKDSGLEPGNGRLTLITLHPALCVLLT